jgi:radical SAM superfamily enzyme YgiQ (UPF0313 family)
MNLCLIFPPLFDPSMPYLAPYQLQSYLSGVISTLTVDVFDLNILFFNSILKNPYANFKFSDNSIDSFCEILKNEELVKKALASWSETTKVTLTRQSINYKFNHNVSEKVTEYVNDDNEFSNYLNNLLNTNVDIEKYNIVGFSISVYEQLIPSLIMAKVIKNSYPDKTTVFGGNIISRICENIISNNITRNVDYLIRMEGELPLLNLIKNLSGEQILTPTNNLIHAATGDAVDVTDTPNVIDMDTLPKTEFSCVDFGLYFSPIPVIPLSFSRGCSWGKCTFCTIYSGWCSSYRTRSIDKMVDEICHYISKFNISTFRFVDESLSLRDILSLSEEIIRRGLDIRLEAYLNINNELIEKSKAKTLYNAGFRQFFFGLESVDSDVLKTVNKEINNPQLYGAVLKNLYEHGISNYGFFITGLPHDSIENEYRLEEFIISNEHLSTVAVSSFIPVSNAKMCNDNEYLQKYKFELIPRGDLTTRCDYYINNEYVSDSVNERTLNMLKRIFERRTDYFISSNIPYEARFYLCIRYGNDFNKIISQNPRFMKMSLQMSDELNQRAMGLSKIVKLQ